MPFLIFIFLWLLHVCVCVCKSSLGPGITSCSVKTRTALLSPIFVPHLILKDCYTFVSTMGLFIHCAVHSFWCHKRRNSLHSDLRAFWPLQSHDISFAFWWLALKSGGSWVTNSVGSRREMTCRCCEKAYLVTLKKQIADLIEPDSLLGRLLQGGLSW